MTITPYQKEYFRENSKVYLDELKRMIDKHLHINDVNVYHVQDYLRKAYKQNMYLHLGMSYSEYIEQLFTNCSFNPEYMDIIRRDVDYRLNPMIHPKIFFYD